MLNIPNEVKLAFDLRFIAAGFVSSCDASISVAKPDLSRISELKLPRTCRVNVHLINADFLRVNSFDVALHPALLITISTGMHASKDVQDSLLNSIDEGTKMAKSIKYRKC
jgi:hypothetical protein